MNKANTKYAVAIPSVRIEGSPLHLENLFLNRHPTKLLAIEVSISINSKILVEQIPSALSTSLFPFPSDFTVVSPLDCKCPLFLSALL